MPKTTLHTLYTANEAVLKTVLDPTEFGLTMPNSIGLNAGAAVAFAGLTLALVGVTWAGIEPFEFVGTAASSVTMGIAVGTFERSRLTRQAMRYIADVAMSREEWEENEQETEQWQEPGRPRFMPEATPSFVQDARGYHRVNHNMSRRETLMMVRHANEGERFPTREKLFKEGFTNDAQKFKELRAELHKKGIILNNIWTAEGVAWIREEAQLATRPTPA